MGDINRSSVWHWAATPFWSDVFAMTSSVLQTEEGRNALVAATLVGAVVLVVGFGSGIGAVVSRHSPSAEHRPATRPAAVGEPSVVTPTGSDPNSTAAALPSSATGMTPIGATAGGEGGGQAALPASSSPTVGRDESSRQPQSASTSTSTPTEAGKPIGPSAGPPDTGQPDTGRSAGTSCSGQNIVSAMEAPLLTHLEKAHFQQSPGQQVQDLLNVNQYVATHTALIEQMLAPLAAVLEGIPVGLSDIVTHVDEAHLEESPGQQVNDLLNVNQYVATHTALVEAATAPEIDAIQGTSDC